MTRGWLETVVLLTAAMNPSTAAVLASRLGPIARVGGAALTWVAVILLASGAERTLDLLDLTHGTYLLGLALVIGVPAAVQLAGRLPEAAERARGVPRSLVPGTFPAMARPGLLAAAVSVGVTDGAGTALTASAWPLAVAVVMATGRHRLATATLRPVAALGVIVAVGLAVEGIKTV